MKYTVNYVNHGIANRFPGGYIEVHRKLLDDRYSVLRKEIIAHEKAHSDKGLFWNDIVMDSKGFNNKRLYRKFVLSTPSSWVQFSPIYFSRGRLYFDVALILLYVTFISIPFLLFVLLKGVPG